MATLTESEVRRIIQEELRETRKPKTNQVYQRVQDSLNETAAAVRTQFSLNNRAGSTATSTATAAANLVSEAARPSSSAVATRGTFIYF